METTERERRRERVRTPRWLLMVLFVLGIVLIVLGANTLWRQMNESATDGGAAGGDMTTTPIVIEAVDVRIAESYPPQLFAEVTGYLPDSCTTAHEPEIRRDGDTITVTILGERDPDAFCAQVIVPYQQNLPLGSVEPGQYTVNVNDHSQTVDVQ